MRLSQPRPCLDAGAPGASGRKKSSGKRIHDLFSHDHRFTNA